MAVTKSRKGVEKILLGQRGVDPDKAKLQGQTPLWNAAWGGQEEVLQILPEGDDANPNKQDTDDERPLYTATQRGHEEVVKVLPDGTTSTPTSQIPRSEGETPLLWAAIKGCEGVVKTLFRRDDFNSIS